MSQVGMLLVLAAFYHSVRDIGKVALCLWSPESGTAHGEIYQSIYLNSATTDVMRRNMCAQGRKDYVVVQWYLTVSLSFQLIMLYNVPGALSIIFVAFPQIERVQCI
ncbi:hypothetical protein AAHA92_29418 [Salvia divinorum]|uniref:Uncharacterized protein n=1 Tax=Salvia divinorum TaxID=28513 RepID=A0ABD1FYC0_SALDI